MSDTVISASGVGKRYRIYRDPRGRAVEWLSGRHGRPRHREVWALRDVSFELRRGSCLGLIGSNGSGKSTLLKILTGVARPTIGSVRVEGRVLSLLELGTGFNPELTGRQNIVASASLMGFPAEFADSRMEDIKAFADIGPHFDDPVRTYSSGMFVRLAFATYMHMDPELFIVDEALSVGDLFFQQKCAEAMRRLRDRGVTLMFASHDMTAVQELCDEAILLDHGRVIERNVPTRVITRYQAMQGERRSRTTAPTAPVPETPRPQEVRPEKVHPAEVRPEGIRPHSSAAGGEGDLARQIRRDDRLEGRHGDGLGGCRIVSLRLIDRSGRSTLAFPCGEEIGIQALLRAAAEVEEPNFGIDLVDSESRSVQSVATSNQGVWIGPLSPGDERVVTVWLRLSVAPGRYRLSVAAGECRRLDPFYAVFHDLHPEFIEIEILPSPAAAFEGVTDIGIETEMFEMETPDASPQAPQ